MVSNELKQLERQLTRQRREKKFRIWLTTLSWTMPVVAFGSFFSIWHNISSAVNPAMKPKPTVAVMKSNSTASTTPVSTHTTKTAAPTVLYQIGSHGPQVMTIQEQLAELGYFHHAFTEDYGPVTAQAVTEFQTHEHLNATGKIDSTTLSALKQAVKHHRATTMTRTSQPETHATASHSTQSAPRSTAKPTHTTVSSTPKSSTSTVAVSSQPAPQTTSSAS